MVYERWVTNTHRRRGISRYKKDLKGTASKDLQVAYCRHVSMEILIESAKHNQVRTVEVLTDVANGHRPNASRSVTTTPN
jgi:hypothetical protein